MIARRAVRAPLFACLLALPLAVGCDDRRSGSPDDAGVVLTPRDGAPPVVGACAPTPGAGAPPVASEAPLELSGDSATGSDDFGGSGCGRNGGAGVNDVEYHWRAPAAGRYDISTEGSDFDTVISVRRGCDGGEITCNDDVARGTLTSEVTVTLEECEAIVIVVEGYDAEEIGAVRVSIRPRESICDDATDNDGDGLTDCDDPDCFGVSCAGDDWPADWQAFEWAVLERTNAARAAGHDCDTEGNFGPTGPLEMDAVIQQAARGHSLDMGEQDYFEHESLDGRSFSDRMSEVGFSGASPWGENIAAGQTSAATVVAGWLESDGHCANIMNPSFRVIGIGYAFVEGSRFGHYWTQNFAASH